MSNLVYTTHDLVSSFWGTECAKPVTEKKPRCTYLPKPSTEKIEDRLRLYRPEIESIASFFTSERNSMVVDVIGSDVFGMDLPSVKAVAGKFREQATVLLDPASTKPQKEVAERDLLARLQLIWEDL